MFNSTCIYDLTSTPSGVDFLRLHHAGRLIHKINSPPEEFTSDRLSVHAPPPQEVPRCSAPGSHIHCGTLLGEDFDEEILSNRGLRLHKLIGECERRGKDIPASSQWLDVRSEYGATCGKHHAASLVVKEQSGYPAPTTESNALISQIAEFTNFAESLHRTVTPRRSEVPIPNAPRLVRTQNSA